MQPQMTIWPDIATDSVEMKILVSREWIMEATQEQKINAMFFFADAWGIAVGLKRE